MTHSDWLEIAARINDLWPHQRLPPNAIAAAFTVLEDLAAEQVAAAVEVLARDGREFPPPAGVIRRRVVELGESGIVWAEVWNEIKRRISSHGYYQIPSPEVWSTVEVADLVRLIGWEHICTTTDPESVVEAQCREKFEQLRARNRQDAAVAGMPSAGLRRLNEAGLRPVSEALAKVAERRALPVKAK